MGTLTLADFNEELLAGLGNRTEDTTVTISRVARALNLAQQRVNQAAAFAELRQVGFAQMNFTGVPAVDKYLTPPVDCRTIHSFVLLDTSAGTSSLGQSHKVIGKPWRWFDRHFPSPEWLAPGWPNYYAWWGKMLVVAPAPFLQFTAQLRYISNPTPFVATELTQASDYDEKDYILLNYSLAFFFQSLGRNDRALYFEGLAKEQLDEAIERNVEEPDMDISRDDADMPWPTGEYWANPFYRGTGSGS
jgi:hypothetical protein